MTNKLNSQYTVHWLCKYLNVAMSGYLVHSNDRLASELKKQDQHLLVLVHSCYLHKKLRHLCTNQDLTRFAVQGVITGLNRIKRLRKLHGIACAHKKKLRITTGCLWPKTCWIVIRLYYVKTCLGDLYYLHSNEQDR